MEIRICNYVPGDEDEILDLVRTGFDEFVSMDCNEEGIKFFYCFITLEEFRKRNQSETFTLTARTKDDQIVGMIEVRNDGHICLLFVRNDFKRMGIAYSLFNKAKDICLQKAGGNVIMTVNSSIYAVDIYNKIGFTAVEKVNTINGISFVKMAFMVK